ncbi:hypothetical protein O3P69_010327 [Scylla paramamosain]|uniref:Uncharacterized protein n=1 Tax=Scylla paramamosain TaxID=85552 RepID=A0AAW0TSU8_SCYPA
MSATRPPTRKKVTDPNMDSGLVGSGGQPKQTRRGSRLLHLEQPLMGPAPAWCRAPQLAGKKSIATHTAGGQEDRKMHCARERRGGVEAEWARLVRRVTCSSLRGDRLCTDSLTRLHSPQTCAMLPSPRLASPRCVSPNHEGIDSRQI